MGTIFLSLWSSLHLCQDDAFARKEPPHPLIVLCQVGVVPVIVSQHSTVEVCLCSLMVFFMPALLAGCICCTVLHLETFQSVGEREWDHSGVDRQRILYSRIKKLKKNLEKLAVSYELLLILQESHSGNNRALLIYTIKWVIGYF